LAWPCQSGVSSGCIRRVIDSLKHAGGIDNKRALKQLLSLLKYVSGDYNDDATFKAIHAALEGRNDPLLSRHSPSLFETVIQGWAKPAGAQCACDRRKAIRTRPGVGAPA